MSTNTLADNDSGYDADNTSNSPTAINETLPLDDGNFFLVLFFFFFFQIKFIVLQGQSLSYTSKLPEGRSRGTGPEQALIKLDHTTRAT